MTRIYALIATTIVLLAAGAQGAHAGTITQDDAGNIDFKAAAGEFNGVIVNVASLLDAGGQVFNEIRVRDSAGRLAGTGNCENLPGDALTVRCDLPTAASVWRYDLGDGPDIFAGNVPVRTVVNGGAGKDTISNGSFGPLVAFGGDGDDFLRANLSAPDTLIGGKGNDTIDSGFGTAAVPNGADDYYFGGTPKGITSTTVLTNARATSLCNTARGDRSRLRTIKKAGASAAPQLAPPPPQAGDNVETDKLVFAADTLGVTVDLDGCDVGRGTPKRSRVARAVDIESVTGGAGADKLFGDHLRNGLSGGNGNDELVGRAGRDTLGGGSGADRLLADDPFRIKGVIVSYYRDQVACGAGSDFARYDTADFFGTGGKGACEKTDFKNDSVNR